MDHSPLTPTPPSPPPIPVVCDQCRAAGMAGDEAFAAIPDILDFDPVPRRAHVNNWTAEHQRAFIAALAITGSPKQAARILGRHMFGAQQLRKAKGGKSFDAAWDAALEISRDREFARIHSNLKALAIERTAGDAELLYTIDAANPFDRDAPGGDQDSERREYLDATLRIRDRLTRARRIFLANMSASPDKRAACELLLGPVDWDRAERLESQADEPFADPYHEQYEGYDINPHNFHNPVMLLTAEAGLLAEFTGGHDTMAEIAAKLASESAEAKPSE